MTKKYKVWVTEENSYSTIVEAEDTEEASHIAMNIWGSNGPDSFDFEETFDWNVADLEEIKQQKEVA
tara:strand:- start:308 stop:508 length:201 start_codon:yes stop_codon:yes gene_type:complete